MSRLWAGFDVGGQTIKAALVDSKGTVHADGKRSTGLDCDLHRLVTGIGELLVQMSVKRDVADGIGIGIAGVMGADGILHGSPNLPALVGRQIREALENRLGRPVALDNDASAAAFGEGLGGAGEGVDDYLLVTLGSGIGSGLVIGRRVYHGTTGYGCELGHTIVERGGRVCGCGNRGCLEAYFSESAARAIVAERGGELEAGVSRLVRERSFGFAQSLFARAADGDPAAGAILDDMIDALGTGLASAVNLLDVTTLILGGGIAPGVLARREALDRAIDAALFARSISDLAVIPAVRGGDAGAVGAARLAMSLE
jgi:glucokinase